ncbi:MAG: HEAT repeat domain-containing protein [Candidatus Ratteibacteria bacterium]
MKKIILSLLVFSFSVSLFSQTSGSSVKTGTTSRTRDTSQFGRDRSRRERGEEREYMMGQISSMIASVVGSKLRHPDPEIRKQALMTLVSSMAGTEEGRGSEEGVQSIFYFGREGGREEATGGGGATYIPDLYELLQDPDPEVRDLAGVGLDILFNTDVTLLRFMNDQDPIVRKYAAKIYATRNLSDIKERGGRERAYQYAVQLIALRTLLVRLKYEKDPGVKKAISDGIEQFLITGGAESGRRENLFVGVDQSIINYLNDPNPVVRKNALVIISNMEYNSQIFNALLERLKVEQDDEVRTLIERTIETLSGGITEGGRRRTGGLAPGGIR